MKRYVYKRKDNGKKVLSDKPLKDMNLILVRQVRDGQMKANRIHTA